MALAKYQTRVTMPWTDEVLYSSGSNDANVAQQRCRTELIRHGVPAIGRVLEIIEQAFRNGRWQIVKSRISYEARMAHVGAAGTPTPVEEDHTTPPPTHD